jgi:hypothetical protein
MQRLQAEKKVALQDVGAALAAEEKRTQDLAREAHRQRIQRLQSDQEADVERETRLREERLRTQQELAKEQQQDRETVAKRRQAQRNLEVAEQASREKLEKAEETRVVSPKTISVTL